MIPEYHIAERAILTCLSYILPYQNKILKELVLPKSLRWGLRAALTKLLPPYALHPHVYPSSTGSSLSAVVSRSSTFLPSQYAAATASRALVQQDDQKQDTGVAHLVLDSPDLTWSKSPSPPPTVSQERPAEADLSRSRADVRRRSGVSHLGRACFPCSVKGE